MAMKPENRMLSNRKAWLLFAADDWLRYFWQ
jgi:hypothetical protein